MIDYSAVEKAQDSLEDVLFTSSKESFCFSDNIVQLFKELSPSETDDIISFFGPIAQRAKNFSVSASELSVPPKNNVLVESVKIYQYAKKNGMLEFLNVFKEEVVKNLNKDSDLKRIDSPFLNNQFIRFIENRSQREELRRNKTAHEVGLNSFAKKGNWESYPINFKFYERFNSDYYDEIKRIKELAEKYKEIGCVKLHEEISETVKDLTDLYCDNYLGFHRITLAFASVVLARMHNFNVLNGDGEYCISVDRNHLKINLENPRPSYFYKPKAYPLYELKSIISDRTNKVIDYLENCPDLIGQAAFDHLMVLVPSVDLGFPKQEAMTDKFFDLMLIKNQSFVPILLGEKDGKCYFVSYFI